MQPEQVQTHRKQKLHGQHHQNRGKRNGSQNTKAASMIPPLEYGEVPPEERSPWAIPVCFALFVACIVFWIVLIKIIF